ncbi:MAG: sialate O-acetylesterase [Clostridiales bacterium]|jgi:hypothetical protein|nr:sialate O-acetylesterase [Clostridiales bacterium]
MDSLQNYKDTPFDVVIQAGQSNAEGAGRGPVLREYAPNGDVLYLTDRNGWAWFDAGRVPYIGVKLPPSCRIETAAERGDGAGKIGDFSLSFAREYVRAGRLEPGRKLLIVRAAVGGTGFMQQLWGMEDGLYLRMLAMADAAAALNPANRFVAFLWHQGESDTVERPGMGDGERFSYYREKLSSLLLSVRERYKTPNLPVVTGSFVNEWLMNGFNGEWAGLSGAPCKPVLDATRAVCREIGRAAFVETDDLQSNNQAAADGEPERGDVIHFSRDALRILGERYFAAFCGLVAGGGSCTVVN